jgi:HK97 family phage portal protein
VIGRLLTRARPPELPPSAPVWSGPWPWAAELTEVLAPATEAEALDLAPVSGAIDMMTALLLQMPLRAFAAGEEITPTPAVLRNPAPGGNRVLADWIGEVVRDLALHGNYVAVLADPDGSGWPSAMYPVAWGAWTFDPNTGEYLIGADRYRQSDVFHVARARRTGEPVGRGLLETHPRLIAAAVAAERWSARYFDGGAVPPSILTHPNSELTQEQALDLKAKLSASARSRQPVVVPQGTQIQALSSDADSAQLTESRRWNALQLAQAIGIPSVLLGLDAPSLTYRNLTDVFGQWVSTTVMGYVAPLEAQLTMQVLPSGVEAHFETAAILRPDYAGRVELAITGLAGNVYTQTEARALVDLAPVDTPTDPPQLSVVPQEASQ